MRLTRSTTSGGTGPSTSTRAMALPPGESRPSVGEDGALDRALLPLGDHGEREQAVVVALRVALRFLDRNAALARDDRSRDHVDILEQRLEQAGNRGRGERLGIHRGDVALVDQLDRLEA